MKHLSFLLVAAVIVLAGCDSVSTRMAERFTSVPPHSRSFAADRKKVYDAAQVAVKDVGLLLGRTSLAKGSIDGYAPIRSGSATGDTRQTTLEVRLFEAESGETRVEVVVREQTEGGFPGGVSEQAQRDHSLYDIYFAALQQVLENSGALKPATNP